MAKTSAFLTLAFLVGSGCSSSRQVVAGESKPVPMHEKQAEATHSTIEDRALPVEEEESAIAEIFHVANDQFWRCYNDEWVADPTISPKMTLVVFITATGQVETCVFDEDQTTIENPKTRACAIGVAKRLQFPKLDEGIEVTFPLFFGPGSGPTTGEPTDFSPPPAPPKPQSRDTP